ncbi:hypothetical protein J6590_043045 [Homalodisca vitripennis]|nr:hypothetical protein J6590_043045 [Homalodisca vitripennis]
MTNDNVMGNRGALVTTKTPTRHATDMFGSGSVGDAELKTGRSELGKGCSYPSVESSCTWVTCNVYGCLYGKTPRSFYFHPSDGTPAAAVRLGASSPIHLPVCLLPKVVSDVTNIFSAKPICLSVLSEETMHKSTRISRYLPSQVTCVVYANSSVGSEETMHKSTRISRYLPSQVTCVVYANSSVGSEETMHKSTRISRYLPSQVTCVVYANSSVGSEETMHKSTRISRYLPSQVTCVVYANFSVVSEETVHKSTRISRYLPSQRDSLEKQYHDYDLFAAASLVVPMDDRWQIVRLGITVSLYFRENYKAYRQSFRGMACVAEKKWAISKQGVHENYKAYRQSFRGMACVAEKKWAISKQGVHENYKAYCQTFRGMVCVAEKKRAISKQGNRALIWECDALSGQIPRCIHTRHVSRPIFFLCYFLRTGSGPNRRAAKTASPVNHRPQRQSRSQLTDPPRPPSTPSLPGRDERENGHQKLLQTLDTFSCRIRVLLCAIKKMHSSYICTASSYPLE